VRGRSVGGAGGPGHLLLTGGVAIVDFGTTAGLNALATQSDGKVIGIGTQYDSSAVGTVEAIRLTTQGRLDPTYGSAGRAAFGPTALDENATAAALQNDGKLVIAGDAAPRGAVATR
jgi:hypothetical protein